MSDDLINKKEALTLLKKRSQQLVGIYGDLGRAVSGAAKLINELPTADRPQGEWVYCEDEYGIDGYRCSNCGKHIAWDYQHKFINFIEDYHTCPFCDARMKGADDE